MLVNISRHSFLTLMSALTLTWSVAVAPSRADEPRRHHESAGGFSFVPPKDWVVRDFPGLKYKVVVGPQTADFAANIVVIDETFAGSLEAYAQGSIKSLERVLKDFEIVKKDDLETAAGLPVKRLIIVDEQNGRKLRQIFYLFGQGEKKLTVTCSALRDADTKHDAVLEKAMKTFQFEEK
jgi:hypothetical protein